MALSLEAKLKNAIEAAFLALKTAGTVDDVAVSKREADIDWGESTDDVWYLVLEQTATQNEEGLGFMKRWLRVNVAARKRYSTDIDSLATSTLRTDSDSIKQVLDGVMCVFDGDYTFGGLAINAKFAPDFQLDSDKCYGNELMVYREYVVEFHHKFDDQFNKF